MSVDGDFIPDDQYVACSRPYPSVCTGRAGLHITVSDQSLNLCKECARRLRTQLNQVDLDKAATINIYPESES